MRVRWLIHLAKTQLLPLQHTNDIFARVRYLSNTPLPKIIRGEGEGGKAAKNALPLKILTLVSARLIRNGKKTYRD